MIQSTRILLKLLRRRILIVLAVTLTFSVMLGFDRKPEHPAAFAHPLIIACMTTVIVMTGNRVLRDSAFPVSDRQVAWIPMGIALAAALAGTAAVALVEWARLASFGALLHTLSEAVRLWPIVVLALLAFWRLVRLYSGYGWLLGMNFMFAPLPGSDVYGWLTSPALQVLWCAGILFFVWEAPYHVAYLRRLSQINAAHWWAYTDMQSPSRRRWPTRVGDAILFGAVVIVVWRFLHAVYSDPLADSSVSRLVHSSRTRFTRMAIISGLILSILTALVFASWRQARAGGASALRALGIALLQMTGSGYAITDLLGAPSGQPIRCPECGDWRMPWQTSCPHCRGTQEGATAPRIGLPRIAGTRHDPMRRLYRLGIPLALLSYVLMSKVL